MCPPCVACSLDGFIFPQGLKPDLFWPFTARLKPRPFKAKTEAVPFQSKIFIFPQGLKPDLFWPLYGTAEAAPSQSKNRSRALSKQNLHLSSGAKARSFLALFGTAEAAPFQIKIFIYPQGLKPDLFWPFTARLKPRPFK